MATVTERYARMLLTSQLLSTNHRAEMQVPINRKSLTGTRKGAAMFTTTMPLTIHFTPTWPIAYKFSSIKVVL